jgi:hypothetical protein
MTYLKCTSCQARLYTVAMSDRLGGELCPGCGSLLEPVGELREVFGYRSITPPSHSATPQGTVIVNRFAELLAGKRARAEQAALAAERWLDDGGR